MLLECSIQDKPARFKQMSLGADKVYDTFKLHTLIQTFFSAYNLNDLLLLTKLSRNSSGTATN